MEGANIMKKIFCLIIVSLMTMTLVGCMTEAETPTIRVEDSIVQWFDGEVWIDLYSIEQESEQTIEFDTSEMPFKWRFVGDQLWQDIPETHHDYALEYQQNDEGLLVRYNASSDWHLIPIDTLNNRQNIDSVRINPEGYFVVVFEDEEIVTQQRLEAYAVVFMVEGEIIDIEVAIKGSSVKPPTLELDEDQQFIKWSLSLETIDENTVVHAIIEPLESEEPDSEPIDYILDDRLVPGTGANGVIIPADPQRGFNVPYFIYTPSTRYQRSNEGKQQYLILEGLNFNIVGNDVEGMLQENFQAGPHSHVVRDLTERLYLPKIVPYIPKVCVYIDHGDWREYGHFHALDSTITYLEDTIEQLQFCDFFGGNVQTVSDEYLESLFNIHEQVHSMTLDAIQRLNASGWELEEEIFVAGFSASGSFADIYTSVYPDQVKAMFAGGLFLPTVPANSYQGHNLIYQLGTYDHERLFGRPFDLEAFNQTAKVYYMGEGETIDALGGSDVYTNHHRDIAYTIYGRDSINQRWYRSQEVFFEVGGEGLFITDKTKEHVTSQEVIDYLITFFQANRESVGPVYPIDTSHPQLVLHLNGNVYEDPEFVWDWNSVRYWNSAGILGNKEPAELFAQRFGSLFQGSDLTDMFTAPVVHREFLVFLMHDQQIIHELGDFLANADLPKNDIAYFMKGDHKIIYIHQTTESDLIEAIRNLTEEDVLIDFTNATKIE